MPFVSRLAVLLPGPRMSRFVIQFPLSLLRTNQKLIKILWQLSFGRNLWLHRGQIFCWFTDFQTKPLSQNFLHEIIFLWLSWSRNTYLDDFGWLCIKNSYDLSQLTIRICHFFIVIGFARYVTIFTCLRCTLREKEAWSILWKKLV